MTAEGEEDGVGEGKGKEEREEGEGSGERGDQRHWDGNHKKNACRAFSAQPETDESLEARFWW